MRRSPAAAHRRSRGGQAGEAKPGAVACARRHLATRPKANLVILGDFNEGQPVGSPDQSLAVIFQSQSPMADALRTLAGKIRTHTDGKAYDRIIISEALSQGLSGLKLDAVQIQEHRHGKVEERRLDTDQYPVPANVKTLRGMIAGCKKIRDDKGYWEHFES